MPEATELDPKPEIKAKTKESEKDPAEPKAPFLLPILESRVVANFEGRLTAWWRATTPAGTPFEHVLDPRYWTHTAHHFHVGDKISIETDDRTYYGELYVRHCERTFAHVEKTLVTHFSAAIPAPAQEHFQVRYMGPHKQWTVLDLKSGKSVKESLPSRENAESFLQSYLRARAA